ncbi:unnamed protein product [Adineta ricciae]|uniref:Uncharacterized protein n=1 Tax=Adineta ricciae TaxID=249248 RepID=A0A815T769_ADIRI|nr:unnamed protein product [Adineta ricciae]CAF1537738.1 unnamed protein product [Adineta ricciae]
MDKRLAYLLLLFIIVEQVFTSPIDGTSGSLSPAEMNQKKWKTSEVLNCVRRLKSFLLRPIKNDLSTKVIDCLQEKAQKANKKSKKS